MDPWDYNKRANICIVAVPREEIDGKAEKTTRKNNCWESSPNLAKGKPFLEAEPNSHSWDQINPHQDKVKLLKTKDREKNLKNKKEKKSTLQGKNSSNDSRFLLRKHGGQKEVAQLFKCWK